ncbi:MAG: hypothetical protein ACT4OY_01615 [Alphaproteobacteria bacterium]
MDAGILSSIFNIQNAIMIGVDVLLFAWMHFTPEGMAFGATVASTLGMTSGVATTYGLTQTTTTAGAAVLTL